MVVFFLLYHQSRRVKHDFETSVCIVDGAEVNQEKTPRAHNRETVVIAPTGTSKTVKHVEHETCGSDVEGNGEVEEKVHVCFLLSFDEFIIPSRRQKVKLIVC